MSSAFQNGVPWLSVLWLVPLAGSVLIILLPPGLRQVAKWTGLVFGVLTLAVAIVIAVGFKSGSELGQQPTNSSKATGGYRRSAPATPSAWTGSRSCWCC